MRTVGVGCCVGQRFVRRERIVVFSSVSCESAGEETARGGPTARRRDRLNRRERALMIALLGVDVPQRQTGAIVGRMHLQRGVQIVMAVAGVSASSPLMKFSKAGNRRLLGVGRLTTGGEDGVADDGARRPREPIEDGEQVRDRAALGHVGLHAAGLERELRARTTRPSSSSCSEPTNHLRGADELGDPDHRGVGEHRGGRHLQTLERLLPLGPRDRADAERVEVVGQQHAPTLRRARRCGRRA